MSDQLVAWYEDRGDEMDRLLSGRGLLEAARTKELIQRHVPTDVASILDVGGGGGFYASWLGGLGHRVEMVDPVPLHVEHARRAAGSPPTFEARVGDARSLPYADETFDVVLVLGPLYHLRNPEDRLLALREARRVSKRGGVVFAAAISRYALPGDGIRNGWIDNADDERAVEHMLVHGSAGALGRGFADISYFHRADELRAEATAADLSVDAVYGIEGPAFLVDDIDGRWIDLDSRARLLWAARIVEREPGVQEISGHLLAVARRAD